MRQETMTDERVRRSRRDAKETILRAASRVFNQEGTAATVDAIADEAGYSTSALYKHFSGRDEIFESLWRRLFNRMANIFGDKPPVELPFEQTVKWLYYQMMDVALEDWDYFVAAIANRPSLQELMNFNDPVVIENVQRIQQVMNDLMQRGIDEGAIRSELDPEFCQHMLDGMLRSMSEISVMRGELPSREQFDQIFDFFLLGAAPRS